MILLYIFAIVFIITPFLTATGHPHWFFRTADFVRLQSIVIEIGLVLLFFFFGNFNNWFDIACTVLLLVAIMYQLVKVYEYSSFYPRSRCNDPSSGMISVLAANVLQTNTNYKGFVNIIDTYDPDIVLMMESNLDWEKGVREIASKYPHKVEAPNEDFYGMHLYSKLPLKAPTINYLIEDHVPSIHFEVCVDNEDIFFYCLHPAPPSPTENDTSIERDAELITAANQVRDLHQPAVVFGDMNDVVWSRVSRLFKKITGMIDPRVGRGYFSTYHAKYWFMRFPLDHLFHTNDLYVDRMERSINYGSDHFAMYYEIHHKKKTVTAEDPLLNVEDEQFRDEILERAETLDA